MQIWRQRTLVMLVLASLPWFASRAVNPDDLQARFDHESNSVHKAKLFEKLGDEQLAFTRRASQSGDFATVGQVMEKYRDNARTAFEALKKEHPNAERQLNGYKQLQMHIRKALREMREMILLAPADLKPWLKKSVGRSIGWGYRASAGRRRQGSGCPCAETRRKIRSQAGNPSPREQCRKLRGEVRNEHPKLPAHCRCHLWLGRFLCPAPGLSRPKRLPFAHGVR
jgi:hypothetical protein